MRNQKLAVGIAVGAALVAAGVIFFRSKKGKQVMSSIKDAASSAGEDMKERWADISDKAQEGWQKGKKYLKEVSDKVKSREKEVTA